MTCENIIINIVIPIISAIIGGGLTLVGVLVTIKNEKRNRKEEIRIANKPLFYIIDPYQDYDYKSSKDFEFFPKTDSDTNGWNTFIFNNTDKAILVLNYIEINGIKYFSKNGNVIDKSTIFNVHIHMEESVFLKDSNDIIFAIKDSLNNEYKYKLEYSDNKLIGYSEIE